MSESALDSFRARVVANYEAAVARGEHDDQCEYDPRGFFLCHCSKRRREARGLVSPPTEPLEFPPPDCPECDRGLVHDGDSFCCSHCSLSWDDAGEAHFTDDFGEDLAGQAERWRSKQAALGVSSDGE